MRKGLTLYMEIEETDIDTPYRYQNNSKVRGKNPKYLVWFDKKNTDSGCLLLCLTDT